MVHIAEQWEVDADLLGPCPVGGRTVDTNTQDLGVRSFQALQIRLKSFHLLGSTAGEGEDVERQRDILFSAKVAERYSLEVLIE